MRSPEGGEKNGRAARERRGIGLVAHIMTLSLMTKTIGAKERKEGGQYSYC